MAVTASQPPSRPRLSWVLPAALAVAAAGTIVAVVVLSQHVGNDNIPPQPGAFSYAPPAPGFVRLSVRQVAGGKVTAVEDAPKGAPAPAPRDITAGPNTIVEILEPAKATAVQPGDWVSVIGITNLVRNFSIHSVVVIPGGKPSADGVGRSPGGFGGDEASSNLADRVIFGGPVTQVNGDTLTLTGPAGPITVELTASAPLYRLKARTLADVAEGDRIAVRGVDLSAPDAVLAQPVR